MSIDFEDYRVKFLDSRNARTEPTVKKFGDKNSALKAAKQLELRGRYILSIKKYLEVSQDIPWPQPEGGE